MSTNSNSNTAPIINLSAATRALRSRIARVSASMSDIQETVTERLSEIERDPSAARSPAYKEHLRERAIRLADAPHSRLDAERTALLWLVDQHTEHPAVAGAVLALGMGLVESGIAARGSVHAAWAHEWTPVGRGWRLTEERGLCRSPSPSPFL